MNLDGGPTLDGAHFVADLNVVMTWINYPGRRNGTAKAEAIDFSQAPAAPTFA